MKESDGGPFVAPLPAGLCLFTVAFAAPVSGAGIRGAFVISLA